jgi:hypothetical protein
MTTKIQMMMKKRRDYGIVDEGHDMGAKGRDAKGGKGGNGKGGKGSDGKGGKTSYPNNGLLYNHHCPTLLEIITLAKKQRDCQVV